MIKQNKTALHFIFGGILMLTVAVTGCNGNGDNKEAKKDTTVTLTPPTIVKDTIDTMEVKTGNVAPGSDIKPQ